MQSVLNSNTIRRTLFVGFGVFIILRALLHHDWFALAGGVVMAAYGLFVPG
jgi:hypothetical protein